MKVIGLDIETTGFLNDPKAEILEIAAIAWDTQLAAPLQFWNWMFHVAVPAKITQLTGITQDMSNRFGKLAEMNFTEMKIDLFGLGNVSDEWDAIIAHNGIDFDMPFLLREARKNDNLLLAKILETIPLIDTRYDLPPTVSMANSGRKLDDFLDANGMQNPFAHRALTDVLSMLSLAQKAPLQMIINDVLPSPMVYLTYPYRFPGAWLWKERNCWRRQVRKCYVEKEMELLVAHAGLGLHHLEWAEIN